MITLRNFNDLKPYGIDALTGEACGYGYRLLCDITPAGTELFKAVFGFQLPIDNTLAEGWNDSQSHSIMLPPAMFEPLAIFALFTVNKCPQVFVSYDGPIYGVEAGDKIEDVESFVKWHQGRFCEPCQRYGAGGGIARQYRNPGYARNQHAMSGRTE